MPSNDEHVIDNDKDPIGTGTLPSDVHVTINPLDEETDITTSLMDGLGKVFLKHFVVTIMPYQNNLI